MELEMLSMAAKAVVTMTDVAEGIYGVQILAESQEVLAMTPPDVDSVRVRRVPLDRQVTPATEEPDLHSQGRRIVWGSWGLR